jgi:serine/threonine protein kinase
VQPVSDNASLPTPGEVIDGKYRLDHRIGNGAMSVVYQVTHRVTQKRFAMKWLLPELAGKSDLAERFLREACVGGRFEHPNVVEVYDVGASNGGYYMVLELLNGEPLQQRIARKELSWPEACRLLLPCMRAVAEAHQNGIVHRDLKPANIFVCAATKTTPERAKVLDFGLAKLARAPGEQSLLGTRSGVVMGTPHYMPLEQMRGESVDRRVDVYAFGVTLFQALSGRLPYQAATFGDLVLAMASEAPMPLERWAPRVPEGVGAAIARALARHPSDRYADLNAFVEALEPFVPASFADESRQQVPAEGALGSSLSPNTRAPRISEPGLPASHRRWWLLAALAGSLMAAGVGVLGVRVARLTDVTTREAASANAAQTLASQPRARGMDVQTLADPAQAPATAPPCDAGTSAASHVQSQPTELGPQVPEPHYEALTLPSGEQVEAWTSRSTVSEEPPHRTPVSTREHVQVALDAEHQLIQPSARVRAENPQASANDRPRLAPLHRTREVATPSDRARRQWRQARVYVAHAPPPDPREEEVAPHVADPPPTPRASPERPRPPRWLPLRTDEF